MLVGIQGDIHKSDIAAMVSWGRDWLVRDSDYGAGGRPPTHAAIKDKVNPAFAQLTKEICSLDDLSMSRGLADMALSDNKQQ